MEIFKLFGSIFVDSDAADKSIKKTGDNAEGFAAKLGNGIKTAAKWGAAVVAAAGTIAAAIGTKAVTAASEFEASFAKVNTLLADTTDLESYKKEIIDLSNQTGISTDALCESIYSAISASVDQANAIDFVASALKLAEGGFTDAATAVDVMTTAINAYGLSAEDATQVSDYLITTQNLGKTSVGELASSLGKVIPIAAAYGVKMDDLCANTALLTKNGIATAEAITYTKAMLNELGDSGSTVGGILKEKTGQSFAELEASGMSLGDIIAILGESVDGDTSAFNELWSSSEAGVGALTLLKTGAEEYNSTLEEMRESTGATEKAYETMHNTFSTKVGQLKTITTNTLAEIGNTLLPFANAVLDWVIGNMPVIQSVIQMAIDAVRFAVEGFCGFVQDVFSRIQGALESAGITFEDVISTVQDIFSAAAGVISAVFGELWDSCSVIWESSGRSIFNSIGEILEWLVGRWSDTESDTTGIFQQIWDYCREVWETIGYPIIVFIVDALDFLLENWETIAGNIEDVFGLLWEVLSGVWDNTGRLIFESIVDTMAWLSENWGEIADIIQTAFEVLWDVCSTLWDSIGQPVFDLIGFVIEELAGLFSEHLDDILSFFKEAMEGIRDTWENHLKPVFDAIGSFLKEQLLPAFEFVFKVFIEPLIENVFGAIGRLWNNTLKPIFDGICDFLLGVFTGNWDQALTGILNIVTGIFDGIREAVEIPMNLVKDIVKNAIDFIEDKFDFDWKFPDLKLPHFSIQGEFSLKPPSVPTLGIDWYAKGGVLEEPTIFGMNPENGNAMVGGEAGPEAVAPIETLQQYVREAVAGQNAEMLALLGQILQALLAMDAGLLEKMAGALESMRFEVKNREFARLVREAVT